MTRQWFIKVKGQESGPYSIEELAQDPRITPDTLVRKVGVDYWQKISDIEELKHLFTDEESCQGCDEEEILQCQADEVLVQEGEFEPPGSEDKLLWLIILVISIYIILRLKG